MAVTRSVNYISQQRVDTPDMRAIESASRNDFDELIKSFVTGPTQGYVLRGFKISMSGAIGGAASGLQMLVDGSAVFHVASSQSGTFYLVPTGTAPQQLNSATNVIVDGAFAPSAINYVSIEYERFIDDATSSQVYLWDPTTNNETTKTAPRASILRYRIKITTSTPPSNYLPIAAVTTDSGNNVTRIDDARFNLFSQGKGGFNPDPFFKYTYPNGRDPNPTFTTSNTVNPFEGGDKDIGTLKDWMNAVTSEIQGIKGTPYWTSLSSSGSLESLRQDLGNTVITGRGTITHSADTAGLLNWSDDIVIRVVGSRLSYTLEANPTSTDITLTENKVAYITLVRGVTVTPNLVFTNSSAIVTSVGSIAWTAALQSGDFIKLGSETDAKYYVIDTVDSLTQVTLTEVYTDSSTGPSGAKAKYAFGTYQTSPSPSAQRDIFIADREDVPTGENVFWLYMRSDNGGAIPRIYVRFLGSEIEQGEEEDISDNVPINLLRYIGSPMESASKPSYTSALNPSAVPEITDLKVGAAAALTNNTYFYISSSGSARKYYVWVNKDTAGTDPAPSGATGIEWAVTTGQTSAQTALTLKNAINSTFFEDFIAVQRAVPNTDTVRVTNASAGATANAVDFNSGITITLIQNGVGVGTEVVQDGDNLTLAIAKLDQAIAAINNALDTPSYDEPVDVVASGATPPTSINGPLPAATEVFLPNNTRLANAVQYYTVGKGTLAFYLNGQFQRLGIDYDETGATGDPSNSVIVQRAIVVGDSLEFRISGIGGGSAGGGGGQGPQGDPGPAGPPGANAIGGPVAISTKTSNYTVQLSDNVLKGDATSGTLIFQLPSAASAVGRVFFFKKIDVSVNTVVVQAFGAELIDGLNNQTLSSQYMGFMLVTDGTTWAIF